MTDKMFRTQNSSITISNQFRLHTHYHQNLDRSLLQYLYTQKKSGAKKVPRRNHFGKQLLFAKRSHFSFKKVENSASLLHVLVKGTIFNLFQEKLQKTKYMYNYEGVIQNAVHAAHQSGLTLSQASKCYAYISADEQFPKLTKK